MEEFDHSDSLQFSAAQGWLELGSPVEAEADLVKMSPAARETIPVLELEWEIRSRLLHWERGLEIAERLVLLAPDDSGSHVKKAYALHELRRTRDAWNCLMAVRNQFPDVALIRYNLACYACQMGDLSDSVYWLENAFRLGNRHDLKRMALEDGDLEALRPLIGRM